MIIRYAASEQYDGLPATGDIGVRGAMWHVVAAIPCADVLSNDRHNVTYQPTVTSTTYANLFHHPGAPPRWWMGVHSTWTMYGQQYVVTVRNHA
jgi:hypothetical protein